MGTVAGHGGEHLVGPVATLIGRDVPRAPQSPRPPWRWDAGAAHEGAMNSRGLDIASMTPQERLSLLDALWDSLAATPEAILLTEAQCAELDRRLDELDVEGPVGIPWEEVFSRIRSRRR